MSPIPTPLPPRKKVMIPAKCIKLSAVDADICLDGIYRGSVNDVNKVGLQAPDITGGQQEMGSLHIKPAEIALRTVGGPELTISDLLYAIWPSPDFSPELSEGL